VSGTAFTPSPSFNIRGRMNSAAPKVIDVCSREQTSFDGAGVRGAISHSLVHSRRLAALLATRPVCPDHGADPDWRAWEHESLPWQPFSDPWGVHDACLRWLDEVRAVSSHAVNPLGEKAQSIAFEEALHVLNARGEGLLEYYMPGRVVRGPLLSVRRLVETPSLKVDAITHDRPPTRAAWASLYDRLFGEQGPPSNAAWSLSFGPKGLPGKQPRRQRALLLARWVSSGQTYTDAIERWSLRTRGKGAWKDHEAAAYEEWRAAGAKTEELDPKQVTRALLWLREDPELGLAEASHGGGRVEAELR
jgi:hypothetical protein